MNHFGEERVTDLIHRQAGGMTGLRRPSMEVRLWLDRLSTCGQLFWWNLCSFSKCSQQWTAAPWCLCRNGAKITFWGKPWPCPQVSTRPTFGLWAAFVRHKSCPGSWLTRTCQPCPAYRAAEAYRHLEWHSKSFPRDHLRLSDAIAGAQDSGGHRSIECKKEEHTFQLL